jgi:hypothetical protein
MSEHANVRTDYERSDVSARLVGILAAGLGLVLLASPFILWACYPDSVRSAAPAYPRVSPPQPVLQIDPAEELRQFEQAEKQRLETYGWIDRARQTLRIPIEHAMELTRERGLPGWRVR